MKRAQLLLALSAIAGPSALLSASDCDSTKPSGCTTCTCAQDDEGLLDLVDSVVGRIHAGVRQGVNKFAGLPARVNRSSCGCEQQSAGCECETCQPSNSNLQSTPAYSESYSAPPPYQKPSNLAPYQGAPSQNSNLPPSLKVPAPIPDSQVDPFVDEPARSGQSRVRGKTIQYRSNNNSEAPPRATYGQKFNSQAKRTPTTADYWSQGGRQTQQVAPASSQTPTLEEVFRPAYRVSLRDADEETTDSQAPTRSSSLRPVPKSNLELHSSGPSESVETYERVIKPTPVYDNPLRR